MKFSKYVAKRDAEKELLLKMHEQFSENQNDTNNRFITIFISVLVLFGAYGLAYGIASKLIYVKDWDVKPNAVFFLAIVVSLVLTFLIILLIYQGYQHRRDQLLNTSIRQKYVNPSDFEKNFNGYKGLNKSIVSYLPDYTKIQALFLYIIKLTVLISLIIFSANVNACNDTNKVNTICCTYTNVKCNTEPKTLKKYSSYIDNSNNFCPTININTAQSDTLKKTIASTNIDSPKQCDFSCYQLIAIVIVLVCQILIFYMLSRYHKKYEAVQNKPGTKTKQETINKKKSSKFKSMLINRNKKNN